MKETLPISRDVKGIDPSRLVAGRYGTRRMCDTWGWDLTIDGIMNVQAAGLEVLNDLMPGRLPDSAVHALVETANIRSVKPERVRELEALGKHDVIAVNTAWGEAAGALDPRAPSLVGYLRTSADSTETAKALQMKRSLEILVDSVENLRDIVLEKSYAWQEIPFMDQTHLLDALPTVAGRPLSFYAEELQDTLDFISFIYQFSIVGKWSDATGNHHTATAVGIDGIRLQDEYVKRLGIKCMTAAAQVPSRTYLADIDYTLGRTLGAVANLGHYVRRMRGSDTDVFFYRADAGRKGSSAMPHKDLSGGNPDYEEQAEAFLRLVSGNSGSGVGSIVIDYARELTGSAFDRITLEQGFKLTDHATLNMADIMHRLDIHADRSRERIHRTYGVTTAQHVMMYLVDPLLTENPLPRSEAHDLVGRLATTAYRDKRQFLDVLVAEPAITSCINPDTLTRITDTYTYIGQSKEIVRSTYEKFHGKRTALPGRQL